MPHEGAYAELGDGLRRISAVRGLTLKAAAEPAGISDTYLQHLEQGKIRNPSPHVLRGLARAYDVSYVALMKLAGYAMEDEGNEQARERRGVLAEALSDTALSEEEERQVADFIAYLRHRRGTD